MRRYVIFELFRYVSYGRSKAFSWSESCFTLAPYASEEIMEKRHSHNYYNIIFYGEIHFGLLWLF